MDITWTSSDMSSPKVWVTAHTDVEVLTPDAARLYGLELIRAADKAEESE